ncbi:hypothetical protein FQR65_LT08592 [Abscondita terminalis]|nr:hypothetical protein FQR65_LT08592 [Abscondita terminalis]
MSWPQWPTGNVPQSSMVQPSILNPAPPVTANPIPTSQYTAEQWAQMQHQNWQQWVQWQQQFQLWQQQYGAEYQKSVSAITQAGMPTQPSTNFINVPPPPAEVKPPPPPPDDGASSFATNVPPPIAPSNYTTAPPPQLPNSNLPTYDNNKYPQNRNKPPSTNPNNFQQYDTDGNPPRWGMETPKPSSDFEPVAPTPPKTANIEELSEAEKKFDKQFHDWEAQFQKWKQQNANHPDKQQYREYEKKWETWRSQLLDRREQMKRKRLGLTNTLSQVVGDKLPKKPDPLSTQFEQQPPSIPVANKSDSGVLPEANNNREGLNQTTPELIQNVPTKPVGFLRPPPNLNNQPLEFKKSNESFGIELQNDNNKFKMDSENCDFINTTNSGGIPGLDLVKDLTETEEHPPVAVENPKPDLEAISRGINSILGDQKLMNMLSLVSQNQNQNRTFTPDNQPKKVESPKFSPTDSNPKDYDDYESDHLKFQQLDEEYEQYSQSNSDVHNKFNFDEENFDENDEPFEEYHNDENFGHFSNTGRDSFFNKNVSHNPNDMRSNEFDRDTANWKKDTGFNKGFEKFPPDFGDFNRNSGNMGQGNRGSFRSGNNWNKPSNAGAFKNNFGSEPDDFSQSFDMDPDDYNDGYNRHPPNFKKGPIFNADNLNRGPIPFNRDPGFQNIKFDRQPSKGNNNYGMGSNAFHRNFNEDCNASMPNKEGNFGKGGNLPPLFGRNANNSQQRSNIPPDDCNRFSSGEFYSAGGNSRNSGGINEDFQRKPDFDNLYTSRNNFPPNFNNRNSKNLGYDNSTVRPTNLPNKNEDFGKDNYLVEGTRNRNPRNEDILLSKPITTANELNRINSNTPASTKIEQCDDDPDSDVGMWKTKTVIDYDHKSLVPDDIDIILEACHAFDYRHKPLNRIPYPSRPKWLSEMINKYPEFNLPGSRNSRPLEYNRSYPIKNRFESGYFKYDDRSRNERNKRLSDNFDRDRRTYDDRSRKLPDEKERRGYDNKGRKVFDEKDRRGYDDRERKPFEDKNKMHETNIRIENKSGSEDQRLPNKTDNYYESNFEDFDDEELDFENFDTYANEEPEVDNVQPERKVEQPTVTAPKSNVLHIEDILSSPGRFTRPPRIVIILRGPPGSGKSFLAKLIKDKEVENGGSAPRILCLDDYFMVEQEKEVEEDGRKVKIKEMVYEYEEEMESVYRQSLMKSFKKTITDGYFNFIIVDNVNDKVKYFGEMWSFAKQNGFQVYICQMELDVQICTKRNIHGRSEAEIEKCVNGWEQTPSHHPVLDATTLIQSGSIPEVEMEEINSPSSDHLNEEREFLQERLIASKWDNFDYTNDNLAKLDGTNKPLRPNRTMEDYLQLDDEWIQPVSSKPGQKRVRWADLEERKEQEKMRAIGFVVGQTNWDRMMDPTMGGSALTQTKYIERYSKY